MDDELRDSHVVALHQVIQSIARRLDSREVLPLIAAKARTLTSAESTSVVLLDSSRSFLDFAAVSGADASEMVGQRVLVDDALLGHTALTGEIYLADNLTTSKPLLPSLDPDRALSLGVRSAAVVPIYLTGTPVGALAALNRSDNESFTGVDVLRLQMLASAAAIALGQERLRGEAQQQQRERNILLEAAQAGASSLNVQDVLQSILRTLGDSMDMSAGAVLLVNDERNRLYIAADIGLSDDDRDRQFEADAGWASQLLGGAVPYCISDIERPGIDSPISFAGDLPIPGVRSLLIAPLMSRSTSRDGATVRLQPASAEGLIVIGSRLPGIYTRDDAEMLAAVAAHAAISLENAWLFEDATRRAQEATAIYELSQSVGATLELDRVLDFVADSVLTLLHVDKFVLFLHNERADRLEIKIARNLSADAVRTIQPRVGEGVGEGIAGWVFEFETPTAVQDVAADHRNRSMPIDQEGVTSLVSVPLAVGDRVIGVLQAMSSRRRLFTVGEMELLYTIANQAAASIANAQMYAQARQKKSELRKSVRRIARALGSLTDLTKGAQVVADLAVEMMEADRSIVYTLAPGNRIAWRAASKFKPMHASLGTSAAGQSAAAWVARRGRALMIEDITRDTRFVWPDYATRDRISGYLGVPLKLGGDALGVLEVYSRNTRRFTADEVRSLLTFASQASVGLKNALLVEQAARRMKDLNVLNTLSVQMFTAGSVEDLCRDALAMVAEASGSDIGLIRVFGDVELRISHRGPAAAGGDVDEEWTAVDAALSELAEWVRRYGEPVRLPRDGAPARTSDEPLADVAVIAAPIRKGGGEILASIALARFVPNSEFDDDDRRFLVTVANVISARLG